MAAAEGTVTLDLPAERGDILDRNGRPLADSVDGEMVVADPLMTRAKAPELAKFLSSRLDVDYFATLKALRLKDKRFAYIARRVPASKAEAVVAAAKEAGYEGLDTRHDPVRDYPAGDVAANIVGFMGIDEPLAGFEATSTSSSPGTTAPSGTPSATATGSRSAAAPSSRRSTARTCRPPSTATCSGTCRRCCARRARTSRGDSAFAVVLDSRTGEVLALADDPTFDARNPQAVPRKDRNSRAMTDVYEPGSVEKVLTLSALIDAGKATMRTRVTVPPEPAERRPGHPRLVRPRHAAHDARRRDRPVVQHRHGAGRPATSRPASSATTSRRFGLGQRTNVGIPGETQGILPDPSIWTSMTQDRIAFGQSLSVNGLQMAAAVNTIANGGVRVSPSLVRGTRRHRRRRHRRHRHHHHGPGRQQERRAPDVADDGARRGPRRRRRARGPGARLPGGRQDRHRPARRAQLRLLRRHVHRLVRGLRAGRRPALHRLRRRAEPQQRRWRWLGRRPGRSPRSWASRCVATASRRRAPTPSQIPTTWRPGHGSGSAAGQ